MKLPVTILTSYLYCARKLYLERVLGLFEPPKEAMVKGSIRHKVYDQISKLDKQIVTSIKSNDLAEIKAEYEKQYSAVVKDVLRSNLNNIKRFGITPEQMFEVIWHYLEFEIEMRVANLQKFIAEHSVFGEELWQVLTPKIKSEYKVESDKLMLRGIVDQIEVYPDKIVPVELKTGKSPADGAWHEHKIQLTAYIMLLEEIFEKEFDKGIIRYLDSKKDVEVAINPFMRKEIGEIADKVKNMLKSKEIPGFPDNENKCKSCGLKERCFDTEMLNTKQKTINK